MVHWLRFIFSVLALCGLLAAGAGGAMTARAHHHCCPSTATEMAQDHYHGQADDRDAAPKCCVFGLCAVPATLAESQVYALAPRLIARLSYSPLDLSGPLSRTTSPDLRPPIV